jgi:tRNA(adenine34) deaminase
LTRTAKHDKAFDIMCIDVYHLISEALSEAEKARAQGEVPVGAVVADPGGKVVAGAHNRPLALKDPTAHAEILALRQAAAACGNYRLAGFTLAVTVEPCIMCMGALLHARVSRLVFGARDPKGGAAGSLYDLANDPRLNHRIEVVSGVREDDCRRMIQGFFQSRRGEASGARRGTEVVVTGSTRNRLVPLEAGHVGSNPTLSATFKHKN